jgi:hypothetical protein
MTLYVLCVPGHVHTIVPPKDNDDNPPPEPPLRPSPAVELEALNPTLSTTRRTNTTPNFHCGDLLVHWLMERPLSK